MMQRTQGKKRTTDKAGKGLIKGGVGQLCRERGRRYKDYQKKPRPRKNRAPGLLNINKILGEENLQEQGLLEGGGLVRLSSWGSGNCEREHVNTAGKDFGDLRFIKAFSLKGGRVLGTSVLVDKTGRKVRAIKRPAAMGLWVLYKDRGDFLYPPAEGGEMCGTSENLVGGGKE